MKDHPRQESELPGALPQARTNVSGKAPSRGRAGAVTLEFALIAPAFLFLVFGIIEVGRGFMVTHLLANAARDGCRVGVIEGTTTQEIKTAVSQAVTGHGLEGVAITVKVNGVVAEASTAQAGDQITVIASIPVARFSWLPGLNYFRGNLNGQFSLRRE